MSNWFETQDGLWQKLWSTLALGVADAKHMIDTLAELSEIPNIVITMPNADTLGSVYREQLHQLKSQIPDKIVFRSIGLEKTTSTFEPVISLYSSGITEMIFG